MTSEDKANVLSLLAASRNQDIEGLTALIGGMDRRELVGSVVSLLSVLKAICEATVWREVDDASIDAMLQKIARRT